MAVNNQFSNGIKTHSQLSLVSDNGSQPSSERFMKDCSILGIKQIFASYDNPKGNADTERVIRTIKEDLIWPYVKWEHNSIFFTKSDGSKGLRI
jgi:transposase InsO family protein